MSAWLKALTLQDLARKRQLYLPLLVPPHPIRPPYLLGPIGMRVGQDPLPQHLLMPPMGLYVNIIYSLINRAAGTTP